MPDFQFAYEGQCKITADTYEEAVKEFTKMLRGIYSYRLIHPTCSMLATSEDFGDDEEEEEEEYSDPCPDCGTQLECAPGGGVKCPNKDCGYWFCY